MAVFKAIARYIVSCALCVLATQSLGTCKYGDVEKCLDGTVCQGDECCRDGSTCPSAHAAFKCAKPKSFDCTGPEPPTPEPPTPVPPPARQHCNYGDVEKCPDGNPCQGDQCCRDGSTCPSAHDTFKCAKPKTFDCTRSGPPTPEPPTPEPPTPKPTPEFCSTASCCKARVQLQSALDGQICDEFYTSGARVAISMLTTNTWAGHGAGGTGIDAAAFTFEPPPEMLGRRGAQSLSIVGSDKPTYPYPCKWGLVLSFAPNGNFWRYFTYCPKEATLNAQCTDGFKCAIEAAPGVAREVLPANWTYDQFKRVKDAVYAQTATNGCELRAKVPHANDYNEFDTNGLSASALGGIFIVNSGGQASRNHEPSISDACKFMAKANNKRTTPWPVYVYDVPSDHSTPSSLYISKYLECNSQDIVVV